MNETVAWQVKGVPEEVGYYLVALKDLGVMACSWNGMIFRDLADGIPIHSTVVEAWAEYPVYYK